MSFGLMYSHEEGRGPFAEEGGGGRTRHCVFGEGHVPFWAHGLSLTRAQAHSVDGEPLFSGIVYTFCVGSQ